MRYSIPILTGLLSTVFIICSCTENVTERGVLIQDNFKQGVIQEVQSKVWEFHEADTSKNAEAFVNLLWPDFSLMADGKRLSYKEVTSGSIGFFSSLDVFHSVWTDVEIVPLAPNAAVASFTFQDSLVAKSGEITQARGPTTFVWQKRGNEWRLIFADADHYDVIDQ